MLLARRALPREQARISTRVQASPKQRYSRLYLPANTTHIARICIPTDGPVGKMLVVLGRHPYRPAHIHFIVTAPGYKPLTTELFVKGDPYLDSDAVFGVRDSLVVPFVQHDSPEQAQQQGVTAPFYRVDYDFVMEPA